MHAAVSRMIEPAARLSGGPWPLGGREGPREGKMGPGGGETR